MREFSQSVDKFHREILRKPPPVFPVALSGNPERIAAWAVRLLELAKEMRKESDDLLLARCSFSLEEIAEWLEAHSDGGDLVTIADALGDRLFLLFGDVVEHGMANQMPAVFRAVAESNLSKTGADVVGKAIKGPGYFSPENGIRRALFGG